MRASVAAVSAAMARMPPLDNASADAPERELRKTWTALTDLLDLGPEPALRECPTCKRSGMHNATVCIHCWAKLTPASLA